MPPPLDAYGTRRESPLFPGHLLAHADLHNHTLLSDGAGDPREAFAAMRASGLDAAALTDHAKFVPSFPGRGLRPARRLLGVENSAWASTATLADAANADGAFVALRGFEWSHPVLGHMCVWGSAAMVSPLLAPVRGMRQLFDFLERHPDAADALTSFNHPGGRRTGRFSGFAYRAALRPRLVGLEMFNKTDDYLFGGVAAGQASPLVQCLRQGWRPGLVGVSDEHGTDWGTPVGKGRTGLYVHELSRRGIFAALLARRSFASRVKGLRLAVSLDDVVMGGTLRRGPGAAALRVDIDLGPRSWGTTVGVQMLRAGPRVPVLAGAWEVRIPAPDEPPVTIRVDIGWLGKGEDGGPAAGGAGPAATAAAADWVVIRVTDLAAPADPGAPPEFAGLGRAVAYASPIWLDRAGAAETAAPDPRVTDHARPPVRP